jgi:hypothetical protein
MTRTALVLVNLARGKAGAYGAACSAMPFRCTSPRYMPSRDAALAGGIGIDPEWWKFSDENVHVRVLKP